MELKYCEDINTLFFATRFNCTFMELKLEMSGTEYEEFMRL